MSSHKVSVESALSSLLRVGENAHDVGLPDLVKNIYI